MSTLWPGYLDMAGSRVSVNVPRLGITDKVPKLTIVQTGTSEGFSIAACLTTGSACDERNGLALNFSLASAADGSQD
jgi:hypothetical protein